MVAGCCVVVAVVSAAVVSAAVAAAVGIRISSLWRSVLDFVTVAICFGFRHCGDLFSISSLWRSALTGCTISSWTTCTGLWLVGYTQEYLVDN